MKKKLFLALAVSIMLVCVFAVSVNAAGSTENTYGDITIVEGDGAPTAPSVISASAKTVVLSSDGTYYTIPTYYLIKDNAQFTWSPNSLVVSQLGLKSGTDVRHNVVRMEIPEGVKTSVEISNGGAKFERAAELVEISFPTSMELIGEYFFSEALKLTTVKGYEHTKVTKVYHKTFYKTPVSNIDIPTTVTQLASFAFYGTAVENFTIPDAVTEIPQETFAQCKSLKTVILSKNSKLTTIGNYAFDKSTIVEFYFPSSVETLGTGIFFECKSLTTIENFANTKVTDVPYRTFCSAPLSYIEIPKNAITIGDDAYKSHKAQMEELVIPNTVTSIGKCAFAGAGNSLTSIGAVVLSANLTTFYTYAFEHNNIKVMYLPATVTSIPQGVFNNWKDNFVVVFTGTEEQLTDLLANTNNDSNHNGKFVIDAAKNVKSAEEYGDIVTANVTGKSIVYGYNPCKAFYEGNHTVETETCSGVCSVVGCGCFAIVDETKHNEVTKLMFGIDKDADGIDDEIVEAVDFYANMYVLHACEFCATEMADTEEYASVFVKMGYSADEEDTTSISFFTSINYASLLKYEEIADTKLQYGLIVSAVATSSPIKSVVDGAIELNASTVKVSMTDTEYAKFSVRIAKLPANQTLNCCGYVIENDKVTYLGHNKTSAEAEIIDHAGVIELTK
ncbi:MAG: leucine-rich repeat domain-containing protein [Ruminococcaceae bacterium]|nr:leucine-rich repeat domain-containing protein [Oscillospiraceae bacterium]